MITTIDSTRDMEPALKVIRSMGEISPNELIPLLQRIQDSYGYLPPPVLVRVSDLTGIPASRIYGVATFYEQFHLEPHGRHTVRCCRGTACHVKGGKKIASAIRAVLGVEEGQTTEDLCFSFETVACLGTCFLAPVMMVDKDYYGRLSAERVRGILDKYK